MGNMKDGIFRRKGSANYQLRRRIPDDVRHAYGYKEHRQASLRTPDKAEAKRKARALEHEWDLADQAIREATHARNATVRKPHLVLLPPARKRDVTPDDMKRAAAEHYHQMLADDAVERQTWKTDAEHDQLKIDLLDQMRRNGIDSREPLAMHMLALDYSAAKGAPESYRKNRDIRLKTHLKHVNNGETALVAYAADDFIERYGLKIAPGSPAYNDLCQHIARGEIEFLRTTFARDRGDFAYRPVDPVVNPDLEPLDPATFGDVIAKQEALSKNGIGGRKAPATLKKYQTAVEQFTAWRSSASAATVTVEEVERWRDHLLGAGDERKTVRDKCAAVRAVLAWGQGQAKGKLFPKGFPLEHLQLPISDKRDSSTLTYSIGQVQMILRAARKQSKAHIRWLPWMLAYTGARVNELTGIEKRDIIHVGADSFLCIRVEGETRTTKSMRQRYVPIHTALVAEGFLDYVNTINTGKLFTTDRAAQDVRDWIRDDIMHSVKGPKPAPNHGFRHAFEDLRRHKVTQEAANYITGRANSSSDQLYGQSMTMLPALADEMRKFPDIMTLKP